jgi:nuclear GTP-binding protein
MRVKKPTSKRMTTRLREGIKKKAAAQRRKDKKTAKKDVTWKSRHSKDPGIPSSFPYKDRIIEEIEQRKKEREEHKLLMKQQRQEASRLNTLNNENSNEMIIDDEGNDQDNTDDMAALLASAQQAAKEYEGDDQNIDNNNNDDDDKMDEENYEIIEHEIVYDDDDEIANNNEIEKSRKQFDKIFKSVVDSADVILYVLDARDPDNTRSKKIEETILQTQGKRLILLLNKVDLVPDEVVKQWLDFLGSSFPTIPIKGSNGANNSKSFNKKLTQNATSNQLLLALKAYAQKSNLHRAITVGVIGYPNVGKSSIINSLTSQHGGKNNNKPCPVGNQAGITRTLREIKIDNKLKIIDSPGIVFPENIKRGNSLKNKKDYEAKLAVLSAIPEKQIEDPINAVSYLLNKLSKDNSMAETFKEFYKIPSIASINLDDFTKKVLIHIARNQGRLGRGGIPNLHAASLIVLKDWRDGKFQGWTLPKSSTKAESESKDEISNNKGIKPPAKVEQTTIVREWAKEFDLDSLFSDVFGNK